MGELRDRRIVQSRTWLDGNTQPIPPYDYDYTYPITVYEAVRRSVDDNSSTLLEELEAIYRLINNKQDKVDPGIPGQLMTWTGMRGQIGAMEVVKAINPDPASRSHQKVPSERAIGDMLDTKVPLSAFNTHINDTGIHITDVERTRWNSMTPLSSFQAHISNSTMHITEAERGRWNGKADQVDLDNHIYNIDNPHNVTAHQVGTYSRREIDEMINNIRESFFIYLNIFWDERTNQGSLVEYHPANWNPNYVLQFDESLPDVPDPTVTYFALKPTTDYRTNESQDCIIYCKRPGLVWQEVGFQTMETGSMVIRYPDTTMYVWVQGRFIQLFTDQSLNNGDLNLSGNSDNLWRPSLNENGELEWIKSKENEPPPPMKIKGEDGYTPIKGIDYVDGEDGKGVAPGGRQGDLLVKLTDENFDTTWKSLLEVLADLVLAGETLPDGLITWDIIKGRPKWYDELGENSDGFITQRAASHQFDIIALKIENLLEKIEGPGGFGDIKQDLFDHINNFNNPHRVTPAQIGAVSTQTFLLHTQNYDNPHNVTADQIGLGNVNNTSDLDKPVSVAVQIELNKLLEMINQSKDEIDGLNYITDVVWTNDSCTLTFTYRDGNEVAVILPIKDIFNTIYYDDVERELVIVLPDGTENRINIASLIKVYTGTTSQNIQVVVNDDDTITATVLPSSIGELEIVPNVHLRGSPTTTTQPASDKSTRIATTEYVRSQVIDNLISYETDRPLSANMGRILNQKKVDLEDIIQIINDLEGVEVIDNLDSTSPQAALSANMGRYLDLTKAPRVHTSPSGATFGRATISLFGHTRASDVDPLMDGTVFRGTDDGYYARADHRHPTDITRAPIHWPDVAHNQYAFTGEPRSTLPPDDSNDDRIATTEWIRRNGAGLMFGLCTVGTADPIKTVALRSTFMEPPVFFLRQIGSAVAVYFTYDDTSGHNDDQVTKLDVEGTGAATIMYGGKVMKNRMLGGGYCHLFVFDGTYWQLINPVAGTGYRDERDPNPPPPDPTEFYNITFDPQGGSVSPATVRTNSTGKLTSMPVPVRDGYNFIGWYNDPTAGTQIDTSYHYEEDTTLYAHWEKQEANQITITLDPQGGEVSPPTKIVMSGSPLGALPVPTREGYVFGGWFTVPISGGSPVVNTTVYNKDTTIYARWDAVKPDEVINKLTGYSGMISQGNGVVTSEGNASYVDCNINFGKKANNVRIAVSRGENDFAVRTPELSYIRCLSPEVISCSGKLGGGSIRFMLDTPYSLGSPVELMYTSTSAYIKIVEIDENGNDIDDSSTAAAPNITTSYMPNGVQGVRYQSQLTATGNTPMQWTILDGKLPTGLTMNSDGVISGKPTVVGRFSFTVMVQNNSGTMSSNLSIEIDYPPVTD